MSFEHWSVFVFKYTTKPFQQTQLQSDIVSWGRLIGFLGVFVKMKACQVGFNLNVLLEKRILQWR